MASNNNPLLPANVSETGKLISHFRVGMEIGRGSFANVYKGIDVTATQTGRSKTVAIKSVFRNRLKNDKLISNLEIEIKILRNLKNPHIVSLHDCVKTDTHFHLIMDYCSLGDLSFFIKKKNQLADCHPVIKTLLENYPSPKGSNGLNQVLVINFIKQLSTALKFLRSQNLIHRDIKPQNLLLCIPCHTKEKFIEHNYSGFWELPILKVADFGFARYLPSTSMAETLCGSPLYMAPEILRYEKYNAKADLWSVGTVIYEMVVGKPPFRASNHIELLKKIENSNDEIIFPDDFEIDPNLINLICNLLKANPIDRMGFDEFFNDPIIIENNHLIDSGIDSISYSVENEEMYVSEYLVNENTNLKNQKTRTSKENTEKIESKYSNKYSQDSLVKPLNKLVIQEEDEELEDPSNEKNTTNYTHLAGSNSKNQILKSHASSGSIERPITPNIMTKSNSANAEISLKQQQQRNPLNRARYSKNNLIVEKDYVVVEKRNVEVNSFADEVTQVTSNRRQSIDMYRQPSNRARKYSMSVSPSSALKEVLDYTSEKLFGAVNTPTTTKKEVAELGETPVPQVFTKEDLNLNVKNFVRKRNIFNSQENTEPVMISKIEQLSMMAHAISLYGLVKFSQVIPSTPSNLDIDERNILDPYNVNKSTKPTVADELLDDENIEIYNSVYRKLCQEGLVLYLKVLTLLSEAIEVSNEWWNANKFNSDISPKVGELIQWIRNTFNESLEKAEYLKLRINRLDGDKPDTNDTNEHFICEKIIFDRAIEICKETANKEMTKLKSPNIEKLKECESSYSVAIWMLESLIYKSSGSSDEILENEDRKIVESFINSIGTRILILQKEINK
ncbi:hypothetical protein CANINC_003806 [Pichia inconspicua]|uniref:Serine/threonine-protein kinase ATG1 n=1 Tax=Pichia inconspicua TaxID=52247 RepID=A0A4T0WXU5_9ASCO|nr:hypothetical protein CANINC_003806 [[Candida] inconspicua]